MALLGASKAICCYQLSTPLSSDIVKIDLVLKRDEGGAESKPNQHKTCLNHFHHGIVKVAVARIVANTQLCTWLEDTCAWHQLRHWWCSWRWHLLSVLSAAWDWKLEWFWNQGGSWSTHLAGFGEASYQLWWRNWGCWQLGQWESSRHWVQGLFGLWWGSWVGE